MKNILFLSLNLNKGGAERVISILLDNLAKYKDINIYLILIEDGIQYELPSGITPIFLHKNYKNGFAKLIDLPFIAFKIAKIAKEHHIQTIVSFLYRPNYINILTKLFGFRGKIIINIRSTTSRYLSEGLLGKINLLLIKLLFNKANLIISNSIGVKNDLNSLMRIKTKHISIPNPIDLKKINELRNINIDDVNIDESIDYIISVGRLIPLKRNKDLILAFSKIHNKLPNTKLLFLGDGILKSKLIQQTRDLNIVDKVIFLNNVDNPFYYLERSKLFVLTSEIEGFPNVLVEAMACGLPVISSDCKSGPSEILDNGKHGLLYDVGDINALSKKILNVLRNEGLQNKLAKQSLNRVNDYRVDFIIKKYSDIVIGI